MIAYQPRIMEVIETIISESGSKEGAHFAMRKLQDYFVPTAPVPESVTFFQVWSIAHDFGDIVIVWSKPIRKSKGSNSEAQHAADLHPADLRWQINPPDKHLARPWRPGTDMLVVLHCMEANHRKLHSLARSFSAIEGHHSNALV